MIPISLQANDNSLLQLSNSVGKFELSPYVYILEDPKHVLSIQDVASKAYEDKFIKNNDMTPNMGFTDSVVWVKIKIKNLDTFDSRWILQVAFPLIDNIQLFVPLKSDFEKIEKGAIFPFSQRGARHRTFLFDIDILQMEEKTIFLRFENEDSMQIPLLMWTPEAFRVYDHEEQFGLGIYYGIIIVMAAYNFFLFLSLRDKGYAYYVLYMILFGLFLMSQYGLAYEYLWPNFHWGARLLNPVLAGLLEASILIFSGYFLNLKKPFPTLDKVRRSLIYVSIIVSLSSWFIPLSLSVLFVIILGLVTAIFVLTIGILCLNSGYRPAKYFLAAFIVLIIGAILYSLKTVGVLPANFMTNFGMQMGSSIEVTLLSLGLADRLNVLVQENDLAQKLLLAKQEEAFNNQKVLTDSYARLVPQAFIKILGKSTILDVKPGDQIQQEMTILFSDIRSFTSLSESMTPKENFDFLNAYLKRMNPIIENSGGYIDKYIGDGIMALFPNSTEHALISAIEMKRALKEYNIHRAASGYRDIRVGIGIHIGKLTFGTLGNMSRMEVTVISEAVNLASRIEQLCKEYGAQILISELAFQKLQNPENFLTRVIEKKSIRGSQKSIKIYEVLSAKSEQEQILYQKSLPDFEKGVLAYANNEFILAKSFFEKVMEINEGDSVSKNYLERIANYTK